MCALLKEGRESKQTRVACCAFFLLQIDCRATRCSGSSSRPRSGATRKRVAQLHAFAKCVGWGVSVRGGEVPYHKNKPDLNRIFPESALGTASCCRRVGPAVHLPRLWKTAAPALARAAQLGSGPRLLGLACLLLYPEHPAPGQADEHRYRLTHSRPSGHLQRLCLHRQRHLPQQANFLRTHLGRSQLVHSQLCGRFKESSRITLHACTWRPLFLTWLGSTPVPIRRPRRLWGT